jgi:hypothetical protein
MPRPRKDTDIAGKEFPAGPQTAKDAGTAAKMRPIRTFRVDNVSASVWTRVVVKLEPVTFYSVTFDKHYENANHESKRTHWFHLNDLPKLVTLAQQAEQYIIELQRTEIAKKTEQAPPAQ